MPDSALESIVKALKVCKYFIILLLENLHKYDSN
jgi:hypothetical protein